jgi:hypothetical protein
MNLLQLLVSLRGTQQLFLLIKIITTLFICQVRELLIKSSHRFLLTTQMVEDKDLFLSTTLTTLITMMEEAIICQK